MSVVDADLKHDTPTRTKRISLSYMPLSDSSWDYLNSKYHALRALLSLATTTTVTTKTTAAGGDDVSDDLNRHQENESMLEIWEQILYCFACEFSLDETNLLDFVMTSDENFDTTKLLVEKLFLQFCSHNVSPSDTQEYGLSQDMLCHYWAEAVLQSLMLMTDRFMMPPPLSSDTRHHARYVKF